MNTKKLLALWGLKWNPFSPDLPSEGLLVTPGIDHFAWRVEQLVQDVAQARQQEALLEAAAAEVLERAKIVSQAIELRVRSLTQNAAPTASDGAGGLA